MTASWVSGLPAALALVAVKATVVLGVAAIVAVLLRRRTAAMRHLVWGVGLATVALLPAFSVALPRWTVPGALTLSRPAAHETMRAQDGAAPGSRAGSLDPDAADQPAATRSVETVAAHPADNMKSGRPATRWDEAAPLRLPRLRADVAIGIAWVVGLVLVLASVMVGLARTAWMARHAREMVTGRAVELLAQVRAQLGVRRPVRLLRSVDRVMPMTWGARAPVILLPADATAWSVEHLRAVILHELAHVKRHDFATQLVARMACAVLWFHPLVWVAARRMREERELACDDLVLRSGSRASDYAQQLLDLARALRAPRLAAAATVAMARPSQLAGRLLAVLDTARPRAEVTRRVVVLAAAVVVMAAAPVASAAVWREAVADSDAGGTPTDTPAPASAALDRDGRGTVQAATAIRPAVRALARQGVGCDWTSRENASGSTNINNDRIRIRVEVGECRLDVDMDGEVAFTDDFADVARIARGGSLQIEERDGRDRRRVEMESAGGGDLVRRWLVNGEARPYDAAARAWLRRTLTVVFRRTGLQAEERAAWIQRTQGIGGLMAELDSIVSDYAAAQYYQIVLAEPDLRADVVAGLVTKAGARVESDYMLGRILQAVAEHQPIDGLVQQAYVQATAAIESDYEKRQALSAILQRGELTAALAAATLEQAATLDSDYELGTLLEELIAAHPVDATMTPAFFRAVGSIESDYQRRSVLSALIAQGTPSARVLDLTLDAAAGMDSDHEVATLLLEVAGVYPVEQGLPASYVRAARTLNSDYEQGRVWTALVERGALPPAALGAVLDAAEHMDSDHEQSRLLLAVLERHALTPEAREPFFRAVGRLESDYARGEVLRAVVSGSAGDRATILAAVAAGTAMDSDFEQGRLLMLIADTVTLDDPLREALRDAADGIESDYTRGQVLDRIYGRGTRRSREGQSP
jgi:beta-lactamase regulating signal transducer with metallopeptidase domain